VVADYDFQLGKDHLRGNGWRGLVALGFVLTRRGTIVAALAISAKPLSNCVFQLALLLRQLIGI
jgi:hypothetical protein